MGRIQYREVLGTEHTKRRQLELGTRTQEEEPALEKGKRKEKKIVAILCSCASFSLGKLREFIFDHFV